MDIDHSFESPVRSLQPGSGRIAKPCLSARGARPAATNLVLGITLAVIVVNSVDAITRLAGEAVRIVYLPGVISGVAWILVVGAGYLTEYRTLMRARRAVASAPHDPQGERWTFQSKDAPSIW